jgi:signal transduction histidine kinase
MDSGFEMMEKVNNSSLQLFFLYDLLDKRMIFSSSPLLAFFEGSINMPEETSLAAIINLDPESAGEWESCLQLKEHQRHDFNFTVQKERGKDTLYQSLATGLNIQVPGNHPLILFNIRELGSASNDQSIHQFGRLQRTLENYRNELSDFTDAAAHDLDAPLRKLTVLLDRVTARYEETPNDEIQAYIKRIKSCLADMRSLIDNLSMLSRVTTDPIGYVSCNIRTLIDGLLQELQPLIDHHKAIVTVSDLPVIEGDPKQLKQLFKNLLENALRFSKKGEISRVDVNARPVTTGEKDQWGISREKHWFRIEIADNGIGFGQEYAEKVFKPFVRLQAKSDFPGSGLGLAICKRIINNHHGIIYAESNENAGARFILLLAQTQN